MYPENVIVWCGFYDFGVIGTLFFVNDIGEAIIVNGER